MAVKNSLEIIIKQVRLEGGFKRGGRIRVFEANCSRQMCVCVCVHAVLFGFIQDSTINYIILLWGGGGGRGGKQFYVCFSV